ncbi:hypothetical protein GGH12_004909 [Coemansia sp. RSA 1822]|nr:hypothetical protein LPJ76_000242 [Coemansia sp. RSA 638]KAJ2540126.1 hypothetical protein GGF49_004685 [Coemansia sp. RSA 1853]KAJ2560343.1 hypothetical protein GGH12_004909 [Coemansia sp. RSA 1822]
MDRAHRVRDEREYDVNDWYTASRESKALSDATDNLHMYAYSDDQNSHTPANGPGQRPQESSHNWPSPRHEPSYQQSQPQMLAQTQPPRQQRLQPMYNRPNSSMQHNDNHPSGPYARDISQYSSTFGSGNRNRVDQHSVASSNLYVHDPVPMHQYSSYTDYAEPQYQHPNSNIVVTNNLPKGMDMDDPRIYESRPVTASTVGSARALTTPYAGDLHSKQSRQHLLPSHGGVSARDEKRSPELARPPSAYSPPSQPTASSTQYSNATQLSRDKTIKDRYKSRNAGGDSCMGECCESCCGSCMRCACCSVCCCMGPIITTIIIVLVLVGIALALYFNWDKITNAINGNKAEPAPTAPNPAPTAADAAAAAAAAAANAAAAAAPPAVRNLIMRAVNSW